MPGIKLITGIPRSGTTLCCNIINQQANTIALHEPIDPSSVTVKENVIETLDKKIKALKTAIFRGEAFEHGDVEGTTISNPVSTERSKLTGKRITSASRGLINLTEYKGKAFNLFVKQNALFTANLTSLNEHYAVTCIVRNPVDVFMSWWSINLPVSKGRLPAAEKFDSDLAKTLEKNGVFWRQMRIYEWFCHQFKHSKSPVIKYEDIISSGGKCLFDACELNEAKLESLNTPERQFKPEELKILKNQSKAILNLNTQGFYSLNDISGRLNQLLSNID